MIMKMYSIHDGVTEVWQLPFYAHNKGHAMRVILDVLSRKEGNLFNHPKDFVLYEVGAWNDNLGLVLGDEAVKVIDVVNLVETIRSEENGVTKSD